MPEENKITTVKEYRNLIGEPKLITLPSGAVFKVKKLSVMDYIKEGLEDIPNEFLVFIAELSTGKLKEPQGEESEKNFRLFEKYLRITIENGIIEPPMTFKYVKEKAETHLIFAELNLKDQKFLLDKITGTIE